MSILSDAEIEAKIASLGMSSSVEGPAEYRYIRPFGKAADDYVELIINEEGRWLFGIPEIDQMIRGVRDGDLMYVTGRPHSGKTQIVLQSIANNRDRPVILFTYDEVDTLVLSKLIGMTRSVDAEALERAIKSRDQDIIDLVKKVATDDFSNLIVIDNPLNFRQMQDAVKEAEDYWQQKAAAIMIDFLDQIPGGGGDVDGTKAKADHLKRWGKGIERPVICLHQASRSSGPKGRAAGMEAMRYGGDDGATFVLEVFRRQFDESLDEWTRKAEANTVSVNIDKNKRPPCHKGIIDLFMHPKFGFVRTLQDGDRMVAGLPVKGAVEALQSREAQKELQ